MFQDKKIILFDMDGTLIDSVGIWNKVDEIMLARQGVTHLSESEIQEQRDEALRRFRKEAQPYLCYYQSLAERFSFQEPAELLLKQRYEIAHTYLEREIDYKPDADQLLHRLKELGFTLLIATTTKRDNMNIYRTKNLKLREKAPLDELFEHIYTREDAKKIKPDPEIYLTIMETFQVQPSECLVFEDSLIGAEAAKRAQIETAIMYDKYSDHERIELNRLADHTFDNYTQVLQQLELEQNG